MATLGIATSNMHPRMTAEQTRSFVDKMGITTPVALDETAEVYRAYERLARDGAVAPFPRQFVVDRQGRVSYASTRYAPGAVRRALDRAVSAPPERGPAPAPGGSARPGPG